MQENNSTEIISRRVHTRRMKHWTDRLVERARELGWSAPELARRSGVSKESVQKYFRGEVDQPRGLIIPKLADAMEVNFLWLRDGLGEKLQDFSEIKITGAENSLAAKTDDEVAADIFKLLRAHKIGATLDELGITEMYRRCLRFVMNERNNG